MVLAAGTEAIPSLVAMLERAVAPWLPRVKVGVAAPSASQLPWVAGVRWLPF
jgi:hypothetical protein